MHPITLLLGALLLAGGPTPTEADKPASGAARRREAVERRLVFDRAGDGRILEGRARLPDEITPPPYCWALYEVEKERSRLLMEGVGAAAWAGQGSAAPVVVVARGGELLELDREGRTRLLARGVSPDLAVDPTGRLVAVVRPLPQTGSAIDLVDRAGARVLRRVVAGPGWNGTPLFSPDGKTLLFVSTRTGLSSIFRVGLDGRGERQLTNVGLTRAAPGFVPPMDRVAERRFEPAGRALVFSAGPERIRLDLDSGAAVRLQGGAR